MYELWIFSKLLSLYYQLISKTNQRLIKPLVPEVPEAYSEHRQTSKKEHSAKIVNGYKLLFLYCLSVPNLLSSIRKDTKYM